MYVTSIRQNVTLITVNEPIRKKKQKKKEKKKRKGQATLFFQT